MTLHDIFQCLAAIDRQAGHLLTDADFNNMDGIGGQVCLNAGDPDELFLQDIAEELLRQFEVLHEELQYLRMPTHGEYRLWLYPNGHYGYVDADGEDHIFTCGKAFEAKISDCDGRLHWIRTRIEHNGQDYYLWHHGSVPLQGLIVRERW